MHTGPAPNRLAALRRDRELKLVQVAAHINRDQSVVYRYETGAVQIPDDVKEQLAELFGVTRSYLMGWDDEPKAAA